jgi:hypothetical protein
MTETACTRCGAPLQFRKPDRNPDARLLRKSAVPVGYCAACAMANWLQHTEPLTSILATKGPAMLLDRRMVDQMANVLAAGCADAKPQEIDWLSVVIHWDLPFPGDKPPSPSKTWKGATDDRLF